MSGKAEDEKDAIASSFNCCTYNRDSLWDSCASCTLAIPTKER
ncbi:MAG: hypothetical protein AB1589_10025 [Cyanobacteriota bacterium]